MIIAIELVPQIEQLLRAKAESKGISLEDYLPSLIAEASHQEEWQETVPSAPVPTCVCAMHRIWDTPEEDAAWKYLEDL